MVFKKGDVIARTGVDVKSKAELYRCLIADDEHAAFINEEDNVTMLTIENDISYGDFYKVDNEVLARVYGSKETKKTPKQEKTEQELGYEIDDLTEIMDRIEKGSLKAEESEFQAMKRTLMLELYIAHLENESYKDTMGGKADDRNPSDKAISKTKVAMEELFGIKVP